MSNTGLIIPERSRDIGDFLVGRLIPFRKKRMIGPFIFIDHMGPVELGPGLYMDVDQHPHIGLATLTYLLEGELMHADSIGTKRSITPGSVNWMVAGKGVTHTERTPETLRDGRSFTVHGYQIWVALPTTHEDMDPEFHHVVADELPQWSSGGTEFKIIAGEGFGYRSPIPTYSPMFMVEVKTQEGYELNIEDQLKGEIGICIVSGSIEACGQRVEKGNILVSKVSDTCKVVLGERTHLLLFGGKPFPEERYIHWNFVSSNPQKIEEAKNAWDNKQFPIMAQEKSYIPLPRR